MGMVETFLEKPKKLLLLLMNAVFGDEDVGGGFLKAWREWKRKEEIGGVVLH